MDLDLLGHLLLLVVLHHELLRDDLSGKRFIGHDVDDLVALGEPALESEKSEKMRGQVRDPGKRG